MISVFKQESSLLLINLKNSISTIVFLAIGFLTPIKPLILIVIASILMDTVMGIYRTKKLKGWKSITSNKLSNIISKIIMYCGALILFFATEKFILADIIGQFTTIPLLLTKLVAATLISIEVKSIDESYKLIYKKSLIDAFKKLVTRGKSLKSEIED